MNFEIAIVIFVVISSKIFFNKVGGPVGGSDCGSDGCQDEASTCGTNHCSIVSGSAPKISQSIDPTVPDFMMVLSDSGSMNRDMSQVKIQKHHFQFRENLSDFFKNSRVQNSDLESVSNDLELTMTVETNLI